MSQSTGKPPAYEGYNPGGRRLAELPPPGSVTAAMVAARPKPEARKLPAAPPGGPVGYAPSVDTARTKLLMEAGKKHPDRWGVSGTDEDRSEGNDRFTNR